VVPYGYIEFPKAKHLKGIIPKTCTSTHRQSNAIKLVILYLFYTSPARKGSNSVEKHKRGRKLPG
jgi:hypothetical protein